MPAKVTIRIDEGRSYEALRVKMAQTVRRRLNLAADMAPAIAKQYATQAGIGRQRETNVYPDGFRQNQRPNGGPHYLDAFWADVQEGPDGGFPFQLRVGNRAHQANILERGGRASTATPVNRKKLLFPGVSGDAVFADKRSTPATPAHRILERAAKSARSRASR